MNEFRCLFLFGLLALCCWNTLSYILNSFSTCSLKSVWTCVQLLLCALNDIGRKHHRHLWTPLLSRCYFTVVNGHYERLQWQHWLLNHWMWNECCSNSNSLLVNMSVQFLGLNCMLQCWLVKVLLWEIGVLSMSLQLEPHRALITKFKSNISSTVNSNSKWAMKGKKTNLKTWFILLYSKGICLFFCIISQTHTAITNVKRKLLANA